MSHLVGQSPEKLLIENAGGGKVSVAYLDRGRGAPAALLFPMCRAEAVDGWAPVARRLYANGVSSLTVVYPEYSGGAGTSRSREADADAALDFLRARSGGSAFAVAGSSCGVQLALGTAVRHSDRVRAVVALTGPHTREQLEFVRKSPGVAVFSGSAEGDLPAPDWARALKEASPNPASRLVIANGSAHGTDTFRENPTVAVEIAEWLTARLK